MSWRGDDASQPPVWVFEKLRVALLTWLRALITIIVMLLPVSLAASPAEDLPPRVDGAVLERVAFGMLDGWEADDHRAAFRVFRASCEAMIAVRTALRDAKAPPAALRAICSAALAHEIGDPDAIRRFFEDHFTPLRIRPDTGAGFLTAYYEPEVEGSLTKSLAYPVPLLARPADLVTFRHGEPPPAGLDATLAAARLIPGLEERYAPFADRAAIEDGALAGQGLERVWLKDSVEAFMIHVQGSARVKLEDGRIIRMTYAGRNGHPYTSIGKVIVAEGHMDLETMTLARLKDWLRAHPAEARRIMRLNKSYIFFERNDDVRPDQGPIGGAGTPLIPHRSLAVDRSIWAYGLPFFLETGMPQPDSAPKAVRQLMVAQDTGSAIVGPVRADYFMGSGDAAGIRAGLVRQPMRLTVLWPKTLSKAP